MLLAPAIVIGLTSWYLPAVTAEPQAKPVTLDLNKINAPKPTPNYDAEVLAPLKAAQQAAANKAAADAAAAKQVAEQQQAQLEAAREVQQSQAPVVVQPTGDCASWIAQAGITDVANAMRIINWESGCNPNAINRSSGACGVAQELPCGKSGCALGDGACQVRWMNQYVLSRYGSWAAAVAFHLVHNWY